MNEFFKKNILKGFYFSLLLHFFFLTVYYVIEIFTPEEKPETVVWIYKYSELGPPPSISIDKSVITKRKSPKKEIFATPKAVKKIEHDTVIIAKQKVSGGQEGDQDGTGGAIKVIPDVSKKEEKPKQDLKFYAAVDYMPEPKGGYEVLQSRVVTPESAKQNNIHGKVLVKTYIDELGRVVRAEIIQGIGSGCDEAAMRAVRSSRFVPGKLNGQYVRVQMVITIFF